MNFAIIEMVGGAVIAGACFYIMNKNRKEAIKGYLETQKYKTSKILMTLISAGIGVLGIFLLIDGILITIV